MSLQIPPDLDWLVKITAGQAWPKGDEDKMRALGREWKDLAAQINGMTADFEPVFRQVMDNLGGRPAEQFSQFVTQMHEQLPGLGEASNQLAELSSKTAQQLEYSKYMIIAQLALLAAEIAWCVANAPATFGGSMSLIPALIAASRLTVQQILRRLLTAVLFGVVSQVGLDIAVQTIMAIKAKIKGDDFSWNWSNTLGMVEMGALGGVIAGGLHLGLNKFRPEGFGDTFTGMLVNGGVTGLTVTGISNVMNHDDSSLGDGFTSGLAGAIGGGRRGPHGGDVPHMGDIHVGKVDDIHFDPGGDGSGSDLAASPPYEPHKLPKYAAHEPPAYESSDGEYSGLPDMEGLARQNPPTGNPSRNSTSDHGGMPLERPRTLPSDSGLHNEGPSSVNREAPAEHGSQLPADQSRPQSQQHTPPGPDNVLHTRTQSGTQHDAPAPHYEGALGIATGRGSMRTTLETSPIGGSQDRQHTLRQDTAPASVAVGGQKHNAPANDTRTSTNSDSDKQVPTPPPTRTTAQQPTPVSARGRDRPIGGDKGPEISRTEVLKIVTDRSAPDIQADEHGPTKSEQAQPRGLSELEGPSVANHSDDHPPSDEVESRSMPADSAAEGNAASAGHVPASAPRGDGFEFGVYEASPARDGSFVEPAVWEHSRGDAHVAEVDTTRFDPSWRGGRGNGLLDGWITRIAYESRRMEVVPGAWVREFTVRLGMVAGDGVGDHDVRAVQDRVVASIDNHLNGRYRLPNGDQFHLRVEFGDGGPRHGSVVVHNGERTDQAGWSVSAPDAVLVHEVLHNLGLKDEYQADDAIFRAKVKDTDVRGPMGHDVLSKSPSLTDAHLRLIQDVASSSTVQHDHPLAGRLFPKLGSRDVEDPWTTLDGEGLPADHRPAPVRSLFGSDDLDTQDENDLFDGPSEDEDHAAAPPWAGLALPWSSSGQAPVPSRERSVLDVNAWDAQQRMQSVLGDEAGRLWGSGERQIPWIRADNEQGFGVLGADQRASVFDHVRGERAQGHQVTDGDVWRYVYLEHGLELHPNELGRLNNHFAEVFNRPDHWHGETIIFDRGRDVSDDTVKLWIAESRAAGAKSARKIRWYINEVYDKSVGVRRIFKLRHELDGTAVAPIRRVDDETVRDWIEEARIVGAKSIVDIREYIREVRGERIGRERIGVLRNELHGVVDDETVKDWIEEARIVGAKSIVDIRGYIEEVYGESVGRERIGVLRNELHGVVDDETVKDWIEEARIVGAKSIVDIRGYIEEVYGESVGRERIGVLRNELHGVVDDETVKDWIEEARIVGAKSIVDIREYIREVRGERIGRERIGVLRNELHGVVDDETVKDWIEEARIVGAKSIVDIREYIEEVYGESVGRDRALALRNELDGAEFSGVIDGETVKDWIEEARIVGAESIADIREYIREVRQEEIDHRRVRALITELDGATPKKVDDATLLELVERARGGGAKSGNEILKYLEVNYRLSPNKNRINNARRALGDIVTRGGRKRTSDAQATNQSGTGESSVRHKRARSDVAGAARDVAPSRQMFQPTVQQLAALSEGMGPLPTNPNGDCLFEAMWLSAPELREYYRTPHNLRKAAVAEMALNSHRYRDFYNGNEPYELAIGVLGRPGEYTSDAADLLPSAIAAVTGLSVRVLGEDGRQIGDTFVSPGRLITLLRVNDSGGHYLGTGPADGTTGGGGSAEHTTAPAPHGDGRYGDYEDDMAQNDASLFSSAVWEHLRGDAHVAEVDTARFDPSWRGGRGNGLLDGWITRIAYESRRMEVVPGAWVREFTVRLGMVAGDGVGERDVRAVQDRVVASIDNHLNGRYRLPNGDQFHLRVEFGDGGPRHGSVVVHNGERSDQAGWSVSAPDAVLVHEVLHNLGLKDEYRDGESIFRVGVVDADVRGLMGVESLTMPPSLTDGHLRLIQDVASASAVQHDRALAGWAARDHERGDVEGPRTALDGGDYSASRWPASARSLFGSDEDELFGSSSGEDEGPSGGNGEHEDHSRGRSVFDVNVWDAQQRSLAALGDRGGDLLWGTGERRPPWQRGEDEHGFAVLAAEQRESVFEYVRAELVHRRQVTDGDVWRYVYLEHGRELHPNELDRLNDSFVQGGGRGAVRTTTVGLSNPVDRANVKSKKYSDEIVKGWVLQAQLVNAKKVEQIADHIKNVHGVVIGEKRIRRLRHELDGTNPRKRTNADDELVGRQIAEAREAGADTVDDIRRYILNEYDGSVGRDRVARIRHELDGPDSVRHRYKPRVNFDTLKERVKEAREAGNTTGRTIQAYLTAKYGMGVNVNRLNDARRELGETLRTGVPRKRVNPIEGHVDESRRAGSGEEGYVHDLELELGEESAAHGQGHTQSDVDGVARAIVGGRALYEPTAQQLAALGGELWPISTTPNGDCLFESVWVSAPELRRHFPTPQHLRETAVENMLIDPDHYLDFYHGDGDYFDAVEALRESGVYMANEADLLPRAIAAVTGLSVRVLGEDGRQMGDAFGLPGARQITLLRLNDAGGHYLGTGPYSPVPGGISHRDGEQAERGGSGTRILAGSKRAADEQVDGAGSDGQKSGHKRARSDAAGAVMPGRAMFEPTAQQLDALRGDLWPISTVPNWDSLFEATLLSEPDLLVHFPTPHDLRTRAVAELVFNSHLYRENYRGDDDYGMAVGALGRPGEYMTDAADLLPVAVAAVTGLSVRVLGEDGQPIGTTHGQGDGRQITLLRLNDAGGHYLGTVGNTPALDAPAPAPRGDRGVDRAPSEHRPAPGPSDPDLLGQHRWSQVGDVPSTPLADLIRHVPVSTAHDGHAASATGGHWNVFGQTMSEHDAAVAHELATAVRQEWIYGQNDASDGTQVLLSDRNGTVDLVGAIVDAVRRQGDELDEPNTQDFIDQLAAVHERPDIVSAAVREYFDSHTDDGIELGDFVMERGPHEDGSSDHDGDVSTGGRDLRPELAQRDQGGATPHSLTGTDYVVHSTDGAPLPRTTTIGFDEGMHTPREGEGSKLASVAEDLARIAVWRHDNGLPQPEVRLTGYGNGSRLIRGSAERTGYARAAAVGDRLRAELDNRLSAMLGDDRLLTAQSIKFTYRSGGRDIVENAGPARDARRRVVMDFYLPESPAEAGFRGEPMPSAPGEQNANRAIRFALQRPEIPAASSFGHSNAPRRDEAAPPHPTDHEQAPRRVAEPAEAQSRELPQAPADVRRPSLPRPGFDRFGDFVESVASGLSAPLRRPSGGWSTHPVVDDTPLTAERISSRYGIPEENQARFQHAAEWFNVVIEVRPSNPDSVAWLRKGSISKPPAIKAKTINHVDVRLGASREHVGLVGYFRPSKPDQHDLARMTAFQRQAIVERFDQRMEEYHSLAQDMALQEAHGKFRVRHSVVEGVGADGEFHPVTGDHDLFHVRLPEDGRPLERAAYEDLVWWLTHRTMGVEHGAHLAWQPESEYQQKIFDTIVRKHSVVAHNMGVPFAAEPLIRFSPGEEPKLVYADAETTPVVPSERPSSRVPAPVDEQGAPVFTAIDWTGSSRPPADARRDVSPAEDARDPGEHPVGADVRPGDPILVESGSNLWLTRRNQIEATPHPLIATEYGMHTTGGDPFAVRGAVRIDQTDLVTVGDFPSYSVAQAERVAVERPPLRIAEDGSVAINGTHSVETHTGTTEATEFYATAEVFANAQRELRRAGTDVELVIDRGNSVTVDQGGTLQTLYRTTARFKVQPSAACRDLAKVVLGGSPDTAVFRGEGGYPAAARIGPTHPQELTGTHALAHGLATLAHGDQPLPDIGVGWAADRVGEDTRRFGGDDGVLSGERYGSALRLNGDNSSRPRLDELARRVGVNQHAWARVGEGYAVSSIKSRDALGRGTVAVNFARTGDADIVFGYHFATVIARSEDGLSQVTLENYSRKGANTIAVGSALEGTAQEYRGRFLEVMDDLRARLAQAGPDERPELQHKLDLADALHRQENAPEDKNAEREARRAMEALAALPNPNRLWHFKFYSRRPGESFHEQQAALYDERAHASITNPLTMVVTGRRQLPDTTSVAFEEGSHQPRADEGFKLRGVAEKLARVAVWRHDNGLPLPEVTVTGHGNGSRWIPGSASRIGQSRANAVRERLRTDLDKELPGMLGDDRSVTAHDIKITSTSADPRREPSTAEPEQTRRVVMMDFHLPEPPPVGHSTQHSAAGRPFSASAPDPRPMEWLAGGDSGNARSTVAPGTPGLSDRNGDVASNRRVRVADIDLVRDDAPRNKVRVTTAHGPSAHTVRRMEVEPGVWVHESTIRVYFDEGAVESQEARKLLARMELAVDEQFNHERLPNGDQFRVRILRVGHPRYADATVKIVADGPEDGHQVWRLDDSEKGLAHKIGVLLGLTDHEAGERLTARHLRHLQPKGGAKPMPYSASRAQDRSDWLTGQDDGGRERRFPMELVQHADLLDGAGRLIGVSFDRDVEETEMADDWAKGGEADRFHYLRPGHKPGDWVLTTTFAGISDESAVLMIHGNSATADFIVGGIGEVRVEARTLADVAMRTRGFQMAVESGRRTVILLACEAGRHTGPGGLAHDLHLALRTEGISDRVYAANTEVSPFGKNGKRITVLREGGNWNIFGDMLPHHEAAIVDEIVKAVRHDWQYADQPGTRQDGKIELSNRHKTVVIVKSIVEDVAWRLPTNGGRLDLADVLQKAAVHERPDIIAAVVLSLIASDQHLASSVRTVVHEARDVPVERALLPQSAHEDSVSVLFERGQTQLPPIIELSEVDNFVDRFVAIALDRHVRGLPLPVAVTVGYGMGSILGDATATGEASGFKRANEVRDYLVARVQQKLDLLSSPDLPEIDVLQLLPLSAVLGLHEPGRANPREAVITMHVEPGEPVPPTPVPPTDPMGSVEPGASGLTAVVAKLAERHVHPDIIALVLSTAEDAIRDTRMTQGSDAADRLTDATTHALGLLESTGVLDQYLDQAETAVVAGLSLGHVLDLVAKTWVDEGETAAIAVAGTFM